MRRSKLLAGGAAVLLTIALVSTPSLSASNAVPASRASDLTVAITPNDLKPPECAGINLTVVTGVAGATAGTNGLVLGTAGADVISSAGGSDCVLGGAGDDTLTGGAGADVLLGGPGSDILRGGGGGDALYGGDANDDLDGGNGNDHCEGGAGTDTFVRCETAIQ